MKTVACYKVSPDNRDAVVAPDGGISFDRAAMALGDYDLMAIEAAVSLAEATEGACSLLSVGGSKIDDSKLFKGALSRGASELVCVIDDELADADAFQTASALAEALGKIEYDLVVFGEGSADQYAQQVGSLVGAILGVPTLNAVSAIEPQESGVRVKRTLENEVETIDVELPAVVSVTTDINLPRIPKMKDILAAGKKPITKLSSAEVGGAAPTGVELVSVKAIQDVERKNVVYEGTTEENVQKLAEAIRLAL